jgi:hypothetical protein
MNLAKILRIAKAAAKVVAAAPAIVAVVKPVLKGKPKRAPDDEAGA